MGGFFLRKNNIDRLLKICYIAVSKKYCVYINLKKNKPMSFICKQCGICCRGTVVQFEKEEYLKVSDFAEQKGISFQMEMIFGIETYFTKLNFSSFLMAMEGKNSFENIKCEFLRDDPDGKSRCMIYENRPIVCKQFGPGEGPLKCINPENQ